jgi:repressor LexA
MNDLSPRQFEIYQYILDYRQRENSPPTFREIAEGIGVSLSTTRVHIRTLKGKGYITWDGRARSIRVIR